MGRCSLFRTSLDVSLALGSVAAASMRDGEFRSAVLEVG
jgi:hypothetical protein